MDTTVFSSEDERLQTLRDYDILDTPEEKEFDRITRLASSLFEVPVALVSLIDAERQWFKSCYGFDERQMDRELAFCPYAIQSEGVMVVEDMTADPRFADNPLVTGDEHVRFYAGAPLVAPEGVALGTLCVIDMRPRAFTEEQAATLEDLAAIVMDELTLRREVRERRQVEQRLRISEEQYRTLFESANDAILIFHPDDETILEVNDKACELYECAREDLIGQSLKKLTANVERGEKRIRALLHEGTHHVHETTHYTKAGTPRQLLVSGAVISYHGREAIVSINRDISERKQMEEALRESEERFRKLIEHASDLTTIHDADSTIRYVNSAAKDILGYDADDLTDLSAFAYVHPDDVAAMRALQEEMLQNPQDIATASFRVRHADGSWVHLESVGKNVLDDPSIEGLIIHSRDVTDSVRYEAEHEARERAEELLKLKTTLLNNMSHELRTPLAGIIGYADVIADENDGLVEEFASTIADNARRLQEMLDSVLEMARLESGNASLHLKPVNVAEVVQETMELLHPLAAEKELALESRFPDSDVQAQLDDERLRRIVHNLVGNAIKFTEKGSVAVEVDETDTDVYLRVRDTGIGIAEGEREIIFEEFRQGSTGLSRSHEGGGLGLSITKHLVEQMNGTISLESEEGAGSTFTVAFPRA